MRLELDINEYRFVWVQHGYSEAWRLVHYWTDQDVISDSTESRQWKPIPKNWFLT